jgi:hypothetical protein
MINAGELKRFSISTTTSNLDPNPPNHHHHNHYDPKNLQELRNGTHSVVLFKVFQIYGTKELPAVDMGRAHALLSSLSKYFRALGSSTLPLQFGR